MYASTTPTASAVLSLFVMWCSSDIRWQPTQPVSVTCQLFRCVSRSVRDVDEAAGELALLQLVDESDGVVLGADVAVALAVAEQLVIACPVRARALAGRDHCGRGEVGPFQVVG